MDGIDLINSNFLMKYIPICNRKFYTTKIFDQTAKLTTECAGRAFFCEMHDSSEDPNPIGYENKDELNVYGSKRSAPIMDKLKTFESDLFDVVKNIKLKNYKSKYQPTFRSKTKQLLNVSKLIVPSDNTANQYYVDIKTYKKLIKESITKDYKLADVNTINHITDKVARILAARNVKKKSRGTLQMKHLSH